MKRHLILFIALLSLINIGYSQSFSTATDNTCFITITTPQGTSMDARKELCRVHQFTDRVDLITVDNNLVICTWTKAQAISYGYTLETLEQYLLSILNVSCGASSTQTLSISNDTLSISDGNSVVLPSGSSSDSQSLHLAFSDSIQLSITRGNSIKFAYAIDSVSLITDSLIVFKGGVRKSYVKNTVSFAKNTSKDSIILTLNGNRYAVKDSIGSGGGSSSLSGLTSATGTNTIDNANYGSEWQWNSLTSGIGLKLSSNSTGAISNSQTLFSVNQSGANSNSNQTTYGAIISNTKTGSGNTLGIGLNVIATGTLPIGIKVDATSECIRMTGDYPYMSFYRSGVLKAKVGNFITTDDVFRIQTQTADAIYLGTNGNNSIVIENSRFGININPAYPLHVTGTPYNNRIAMFSNGFLECNYNGNFGYVHSRGGNFGYFGINGSGNLIIGCDALATGDLMSFHATRQNVGIGTITPLASAKLEVSSTTSGFLPPRMTATQASAISTPAQGLLLFVSDTNGTFTSVGWWGYNGSTWEKLNN